jgi:HEAT repeat protein
MASAWGMTPRQSIEAECVRRGKSAVVSGCIELLGGNYADENLLSALGGPTAHYVLDGHEGPYWFRVWAARGLLWAWDDSALPAIVEASADESWRVREMAAKVIARHRLGDALDAVALLREDPVARVRAAAERAVVTITVGQA